LPFLPYAYDQFLSRSACLAEIGGPCGELSSLETQLIVATRIGIVSEVEADTLIRDAAEIGRMLNGLVKSLERGR